MPAIPAATSRRGKGFGCNPQRSLRSSLRTVRVKSGPLKMTPRFETTPTFLAGVPRDMSLNAARRLRGELGPPGCVWHLMLHPLRHEVSASLSRRYIIT